MTPLILALILLAHPPCYADSHNAHRSEQAKAAFRHAYPCPGGPDAGSTRRCRGYVIDHWCALECCGLDAPENMVWQTRADAKAKDKWEGNCSTCNAKNLKPRRPARR